MPHSYSVWVRSCHRRSELCGSWIGTCFLFEGFGIFHPFDFSHHAQIFRRAKQPHGNPTHHVLPVEHLIPGHFLCCALQALGCCQVHAACGRALRAEPTLATDSMSDNNKYSTKTLSFRTTQAKSSVLKIKSFRFHQSFCCVTGKYFIQDESQTKTWCC